MAKRRAASEGTVFQDEDGRWVAMIELPRRGDGRRHRKKRRARTRAEARRILSEMRDEYRTSGSLSSRRRTVAEAASDYLDVRVAQGLSKGTLDQNRWQLAIITEALGRRQLAKLTVADCDDFLQAAADGVGKRQPISRSHISRLRFVLIGVLANEMRVGQLSRNVASLSILPVTDDSKRERRALTSGELSTLLGAAKGSRLIIIDLSARYGLRPAEARGLLWTDLDLESERLTVTGQIDRQNRRTKPKTSKSARSVRLDEQTICRIEEWREKQVELRAIAGSSWVESGVVASTSSGNPVDRHAFARSLRGLCTKIGIEPISPYELRHTAITMQADAGHTSWEIADWAGTSEAMISQVYRHRLRTVSRLPAPHV